MTKRFISIEDWRAYRRDDFFNDKKIGFVGTMGNLHEGHASLLRRSVRENDITVLSIFVNPTQFNDPNDLKNYPRTLEQDVEIATQCDTDFILIPEMKEIYHDDYRYRVSESDFSLELDGKFRPGHFDGVLTVVLKLLMLVRPHRAYFGEKDFQQFQLIKNMAEAFFLEMEIIPCPTVRTSSGLALSSRNSRIRPDEMNLAETFAQLLASTRNDDEIRQELESLGFRIDYIEKYKGRRFGAVHLGDVRLIDNVEIHAGETCDSLS